MALLARGWGNAIQILAATRVGVGGAEGGAPPGSLGRAGSGTRASWPRLDVVKELSASASVVAVEWLREQASGRSIRFFFFFASRVLEGWECIDRG